MSHKEIDRLMIIQVSEVKSRQAANPTFKPKPDHPWNQAAKTASLMAEDRQIYPHKRGHFCFWLTDVGQVKYEVPAAIKAVTPAKIITVRTIAAGFLFERTLHLL